MLIFRTWKKVWFAEL